MAAKAVADLAEGRVLAVVDVDVPQERVFRALTTDEVVQWWGADDAYRTQTWQAELSRYLQPGAAPTPKKHFLVRLLPPRPTFQLDMSAEERAVMQPHAAYWIGQLAAGTVIAFGPVADPSGGWGVGIVRVDDEGAVRDLERNDPAVRSGRGFRYEILPMPQAIYAQ